MKVKSVPLRKWEGQREDGSNKEKKPVTCPQGPIVKGEESQEKRDRR